MVLTINQEFRGRRGDCLEFPWKCLCTLQNPMKEKFHPDLDEQAMRVTKKGKELSGSTKGNTWIKYIISVNPANFLLIFFSVKHTFNIRLTSIWEWKCCQRWVKHWWHLHKETKVDGERDSQLTIKLWVGQKVRLSFSRTSYELNFFGQPNTSMGWCPNLATHQQHKDTDCSATTPLLPCSVRPSWEGASHTHDLPGDLM